MQKHRLYRSTDDKMIAGVCGGLADFFGLDVSLVRLLLVIMGLLGGHGVLVYLILWIIVPKQPAGAVTVMAPEPANNPN
jgi:phage shock protein C